MRTCDRRAMCRILSLVAAPMRRTRKNYVDGTPLRNETRLRVAGNGLLRSRASSPRFVPCVLSRSQRDSSHSAWPSTNTEVPSSLFSPLPPPNLFSFSPYTFFFVSSYLFFLSLSLSLSLITRLSFSVENVSKHHLKVGDVVATVVLPCRSCQK